jgi:hypothetical protein
MVALAKGVSLWGIASLILLVGNYLIGQYSFHLEDVGQAPLFSRMRNYELCIVMQLAAAVCGIIAMRRGSKLWLVTVLPASLFALGCFFGDL